MRTLLAPSLLVLLPALAACHREAPPDTRAADDARDIARVKAAQRTIPPAVPLAPEPVSFADLDSPSIGLRIPAAVGKPKPDEGCGFVPAGAPAAPSGGEVFVVGPKFGLVKNDGRLELFAADSGSPARAVGLRARYGNAAYALELSQGDKLAATSWKAALAIRDRYRRIVYFSAGELRCR